MWCLDCLFLLDRTKGNMIVISNKKCFRFKPLFSIFYLLEASFDFLKYLWEYSTFSSCWEGRRVKQDLVYAINSNKVPVPRGCVDPGKQPGWGVWDWRDLTVPWGKRISWKRNSTKSVVQKTWWCKSKIVEAPTIKPTLVLHLRL